MLAEKWRALCDDPQAPDYFELNQFGAIVLSPRSTTGHQSFAFTVATGMQLQLGPQALTEVGVLTDQGVRVPDVIRMTPERWERAKRAKRATPLPFVPDTCVEVLSPGNTVSEIEMKKHAYLRGGPREVIIVGIDGSVTYFGPDGPHERSEFGLSLDLG